MRYLLPLILLASTLATQATRIEQELIEINAHGYNAPVRITPTNSAYAPADLSAPIVTGPTKVYTPVAGVLTISNLVQGAYTFEQAGKRLTFTVTNSLPTITNSIRELVSAGLVYGVNGPGFPGVVKVTPNDTVPNVLGAKLVAGSNITITTNNASGNATLTITGAAAGGSDAITNNDTRAVSFAGGAIALSGGDGANQWSITNVSAVEDEGLNFIGEAGASVARFIWNNNAPGIWAHNFYGLNSGLTNASGQTISQEIAAAGGSGDATLAGDNTWTGTNTFTGELIGSSVIDGASFRVTSHLGDKFLFTNRVDEAESLYLDILGEAENRIVSFKWDNTADNGVISKNFYGSGAGLTNLNAGNILTGTIDAARLPVVWTNAVEADGVQIEGVGVTNAVATASQGFVSGKGIQLANDFPIAWPNAKEYISASTATKIISFAANSKNTFNVTSTNVVAKSNLVAEAGITGDGAGLTNAVFDGFSVKQFGAVGDGTTDDTEAITNAINYAQASGRTLYFPPGTYRQLHGARLTNALHIVGSARNSVGSSTSAYAKSTIQFEGTEDWLVATQSVTGCTFEYLKIKGQGRTVSTGAGFRLGGPVHDIMHFRKVEVEAFKDGFVGTNWGTTLFLDCYARACDVGYAFYGATSLDVTFIRGGALGSPRIGYHFEQGIFNLIGQDCSATNRILEITNQAAVTLLGSNLEHTGANAGESCIYVHGATCHILGGNRTIGTGNYTLHSSTNANVEMSNGNNWGASYNGFIVRDDNIASNLRMTSFSSAGNPIATNTAMSAVIRPQPWSVLNFDNPLTAPNHYGKIWYETRSTNTVFFDKLNLVTRVGGLSTYAPVDLLAFEKYRRGHIPLVLTNSITVTNIVVNAATNTVGTDVVGQLPVTMNGVVYYLDLKK